MSEFASILYFDDPRGMQLMEEVLRKIGIPYEVPEQASSEPVLMIQVKSNRSSKKVFEACKQYFAVEGPAMATQFTATGGFSMTPAWEFKLLSLELRPESIPQVAELITSIPATE